MRWKGHCKGRQSESCDPRIIIIHRTKYIAKTYDSIDLRHELLWRTSGWRGRHHRHHALHTLRHIPWRRWRWCETGCRVVDRDIWRRRWHAHRHSRRYTAHLHRHGLRNDGLLWCESGRGWRLRKRTGKLALIRTLEAGHGGSSAKGNGGGRWTRSNRECVVFAGLGCE